MTTTDSVADTSPDTAGTDSASEFQLHGHGIQISYYPLGAGPLTVEGPVVLVYQDTEQTLTFRRSQVKTTEVEGLGTLVTVTLQQIPDVGIRTASLLVPSVVLGPQRSAPIQTQLIRTAHASTLTGLGHPQRDTYTVSPVTGQASAIIPL